MPVEKFRPLPHHHVIDALCLSGRLCVPCGRRWVSLHGSVWQCPNCGKIMEPPVGVDDALEHSQTRIDRLVSDTDEEAA